MKTTKYFSTSAILAAALALTAMMSIIGVKPAMANTTIPGDMCQPANLRQALNWGLGYSQFGVTNTAPIGNQFFWVTCPIVMVEDDDTFDNVSIEVQYLDPAAVNIYCVVVSVETQLNPTTSFDSQVLTVPANPGTLTGQYANTVTTGVNVGNGTSKASVVCRLYPQSRITHFVANGT